MTIHAYTEPRGPNPAYINISQRPANAVDVIVTVRAVGENDASSIILDRVQAVALAHDILRHYRAPTPDVKVAVDRFLGWPIPKTFSPDCGISFDGRKDDEWNKNKPWPIGTNLLNADEARAMFEHALARAAVPSQQPTPGSAHPGYSAMQPHQQRVVDEKAELDDRRNKLFVFFDTPTFAGLDEAEQRRMRTQFVAMKTLSEILGERIEAFA